MASSVSEIRSGQVRSEALVTGAGADVHGGVVGQDGLLLELVLLEDVRLEGLLGFCGRVLSAGMFVSHVWSAVGAIAMGKLKTYGSSRT